MKTDEDDFVILINFSNFIQYMGECDCDNIKNIVFIQFN